MLTAGFVPHKRCSLFRIRLHVVVMGKLLLPPYLLYSSSSLGMEFAYLTCMGYVEENLKAIQIIKHHQLNSYQKRLIWVRTAITILTPSLILLIGLQDKPPPYEKLLSVLLLTSTLLMTLSILVHRTISSSGVMTGFQVIHQKKFILNY